MDKTRGRVFHIKKPIFITCLLSIFIAGCGGESSSGGGGITVSPERDGRDCISAFTVDGTTTIENSCSDKTIRVRLFAGNQPVLEIPPNSSIKTDFDFIFFGACVAPYTPVQTGEGEFECV